MNQMERATYLQDRVKHYRAQGSGYGTACRAALYDLNVEQSDRWYRRHLDAGTDTRHGQFRSYRAADEAAAYAEQAGAVELARRDVDWLPPVRTADRRTRKALYAAFVDSLSFPDLEEYAFERAVAADRATRKPRNPRDLILSA